MPETGRRSKDTVVRLAKQLSTCHCQPVEFAHIVLVTYQAGLRPVVTLFGKHC
jgi:hypothetical protein